MQIQNVDISRASVQDRLSTLQKTCLPWDKPYDTTKGHWWIVTEGGRDLGFAGLVSMPDWPSCGYLCRAGVISIFRGRGIQKKLIKARIKKAKTIGCTNLITNTTVENLSSSNSLISCGFKLYEPTVLWGAEGTLYWILKSLY